MDANVFIIAIKEKIGKEDRRISPLIPFGY
jgi:hypothetical protein